MRSIILRIVGDNMNILDLVLEDIKTFKEFAIYRRSNAGDSAVFIDVKLRDTNFDDKLVTISAIGGRLATISVIGGDFVISADPDWLMFDPFTDEIQYSIPMVNYTSDKLLKILRELAGMIGG